MMTTLIHITVSLPGPSTMLPCYHAIKHAHHSIMIIIILLAGDAKNEVPVTNLAKIEFPGGEPKKAACKLIFTRTFWKLYILYFQ